MFIFEREGGQRIWSGICTDSDSNVGLEPMNYEIKTWTEVRCSTDWPTQAPLDLIIFEGVMKYPHLAIWLHGLKSQFWPVDILLVEPWGNVLLRKYMLTDGKNNLKKFCLTYWSNIIRTSHSIAWSCKKYLQNLSESPQISKKNPKF